MDNLLERARREGTPLLDGQRVTFVWHGKTQPSISGDFTQWHYEKPRPLQTAGKDLWVYTLDLPAEAYLEYIFVVDGQRCLDPYNAKKTPNGMGKYNNYVYIPPAGPSTLARRVGRKLRGQVTRELVDGGMFIAGGRRQVNYYHPPVSTPVPLIVVLDGYDFYRRAHLETIVDNLIATQRIAPVALAMVQNGKSARMIEYACSDATLSFLQSALLPAARRRLNLSDGEGEFGILGASMGGLMAIYTAFRLPHIFGKALSLSGAFVVNKQEQVLFELVRNSIPPAIQVWMDVGLFDYAPLLESNRKMRTLMNERGYALEYREYPAGHSYPAWRDEIWRGLEHLFKPHDFIMK